MRDLIDNALLRRIRPKDRPYEIRDTRQIGFLVRVQPSNVRTFYLEYAHGKRVKLGRAWPAEDALSAARAREQATKIRVGVRDGVDPVDAKRKAHAATLGMFIDGAYAEWAPANLRHGDATIARLKASFESLLGRGLGELSELLIEGWRRSRLKDEIQPSTINRDLGALKAALNKAVRWRLIDKNPIAQVGQSKVDTSRLEGCGAARTMARRQPAAAFDAKCGSDRGWPSLL